jgi:hypothetical protein
MASAGVVNVGEAYGVADATHGVSISIVAREFANLLGLPGCARFRRPGALTLYNPEADVVSFRTLGTTSFAIQAASDVATRTIVNGENEGPHWAGLAR